MLLLPNNIFTLEYIDTKVAFWQTDIKNSHYM